MHRVVHGLVVPRAVGAGDDYRSAGGKAVEKAQQRVDQRAGGAHGGQRLRADIVAYHDGVHRVVHLLEDQPQQHGRGKGKQLLPDRALGHIGASANTHRIPSHHT